MNRALKRLGAAMLLVFVAGLAPAASRSYIPQTALASARQAEVPPALEAEVRVAEAAGRDVVEVDFTLAAEKDAAQVKRAIEEAGGSILQEGEHFVRARVPVASAAEVAKATNVVGVGVNERLTLDQPRITAEARMLAGGDAAQMNRVNEDPIGAPQFRSQNDSLGRGVTVAIIDTGIDPAHPDLLKTPGGGMKIVDWQDFTREGFVTTPNVVTWGSSYASPDGRRYILPDRPASSQSARFGYWEEYNVLGYIDQDLDRNGTKTDTFGLLLVDGSTPGRYDTVYVDTDNDADFRDEQPLKVYTREAGVGRLGAEGPRAARRLNFVVTAVDPGGKSVNFGFDGNGHGTQVAGVVGAHNPNGFTGIAPGIQLMALKAVMSTGDGYWFPIKDAIQYAASHGAHIINLSIGGLADGAARLHDTGASEWLNRIAREYGVLIVISAANTGPGLSSGTSLGNPSDVMSVGSYYSPEMWKRDYDWVVPHESIWSQSGMGPRTDGCYLPNVVAPGGGPTTTPLWREPTGYSIAKGTSIAAPHVSAAAALLIEAARRHGIGHDRLSIKRALEQSARKIAGFEVYEQGNGIIQLEAAFGILQTINPIPYVQARSQEGNGGILARSQAVGSAIFTLTNLDRDPARLGIFSSADWVRPSFTSLTLPPGVDRRLPLQVNPPTDPGIYSAFVMVTQQNKLSPTLTIPVTHVTPVELNAANGYRNTQVGALEVGRSRRIFLRVPPGTSELTVKTGILLDAANAPLGAVEVFVFRPDGQAISQTQIGAGGTGTSSAVQVDDPVEGVWEVVIFAKPDSRGDNLSAAFTFEAELRPGPLYGQPLKFSVPTGTTTTVPIRLVNTYGTFTGQLDAMGLAPADPKNPPHLDIPWRVEHSQLSVIEDFTLRYLTREVRIEVSNTMPDNADMNLYLYYFDPREGPQLWAQSTRSGTSREVIEVSNLPPGRWQVLKLLASPGSDAVPLQYQYRRLMGLDQYQVTVQDPVRKHTPGEVWTASLTIEAPQTPGRYSGHVLVRDTEHGKILGWIPFEVAVGQPSLSVEAMASQVVRGRTSNVILELRDAESGRLTDGTIIVNGQRFISLNGQVTVPVTAVGPTYVLDVEVDMPAYQFNRYRITIPVKDVWGFHPLGVDSGQENDNWRRKVITQLP